MSLTGRREAIRVLVFNSRKKLIATYHSSLCAAKMLRVTPNSIRSACTGKTIAVKGHYFRYLPDDIEVTFEDLGVLTVNEYDDLCGVDRKVFPNARMSRVGMKYKVNKNNQHGSANH
jgi:hypothetical protein